MAAELIARLEKLHNISDDLHWFCPKGSPDDADFDLTFSDDEDLHDGQSERDRERRRDKVETARERRDMAMNCLAILAFEGEEAQHHQQIYEEGLKAQLTRCDECVRSYYRELPNLFERLHETYEDEMVDQFSGIVDSKNIERISSALDTAKEELLGLPEDKRTVTYVSSVALFGLFEALSCQAFLTNEDLLSKHFDQPFQLIQTKRKDGRTKKLKIQAYCPGLTAFLFGDNQERADWARWGWIVMKKQRMSRADFDWAVRDYLHQAMARVQIHSLDAQYLPAFWNGARVMVGCLTPDVITHSLRAMETDIYKLALEHLQIDSPGFQDLLATIQNLFLVSGPDFWDAMGTISPVTVIEQIFNAPSLGTILATAGKGGATDLVDLTDGLSWVKSLVNSLKPAAQVPACRALLNQLLGRLQGDHYTKHARAEYRQLGLSVLELTLRHLLETQSTKSPAGEATIAEILEVVAHHVPDIASDVRSLKVSVEFQKEANIGLEIVQQSVSLDCKVLVREFERLSLDSSTSHHRTRLGAAQSEALWRVIIKNVTKYDLNLAAVALYGSRELTGLEPFRNTPNSASDVRAFTESFSQTSGHVRELLQRLSEFSDKSLRELFNNSDNASAVLATLFSSDQLVHDAALELLKAAGSATGRREAVEFAVQNHFYNTLSMSSNYILRIAHARIFTPMSRTLKLCSDMVDVLCNSQDGILRSRDLSSEQSSSLEAFWRAMWQMLTTVFKSTELWSKAGHEKETMKDFCRDTMQFAESLFDHYAIFKNALRDSKATRTLLDYPKASMKDIVIWLRLRDEYLYTKNVSLIGMLLRRLKEESIELDSQVLEYIETVINGTVKTALSGNQKAELTRSFETYTGTSFDDDDEVVPIADQKLAKLQPKPRQGQLDIGKWKAKAESQQPGSGLSSGTESQDETLSKFIKRSSGSVETWKALAAKHNQQRDERHKITTVNVVPRKATPAFVQTDPSEIRKIREKEKEEKRKRDAAAIARARGLREGIGGSGTKGIGVPGKDHTQKGQGIYVDSEESDSEDQDEALFGPSVNKKAKKPVIADKGVPLPQLPVKKKKILRSQKEMRARLAPDLSKLHSTILGWDFFYEGDYPPGSRTELFSAVPNQFSSPLHYKQVFQPLLELEAWQGFVKSREENTSKPYEIKIANRSSVDAFIEVSTTMTHADNRETQIAEGDVVLMSKNKSPSTAYDAAHCLARVFRLNRKKAHIEILYRVVPANKLLGSLVPNATLFAVKLQSLTPLEREYGALCSLEYYDLCDEITKAKPSPLLKYSDKQLESYISTYSVNKAQAKAIKSAIDNDAFTLIQGPPGSGKTKTIVAIVGALLSSTLGSSSGDALQRPGVPRPGSTSMAPMPKKLMVCAPSNAAVDELVMRFKAGIKTTSGALKKVNVVRLGRSDAINAQVHDVTLEALVNKRLEKMPGQDTSLKEKTSELMKQHKLVCEQVNVARDQLESGAVKGDEASYLQDEFNALRRRKQALSTQIDDARDKENSVGRQADINRRNAQQEILNQAHIICATLSGSGHEMFRNVTVEFETVVVDEAAQCVEISALIPLKYGCAKCILVGDPKQLPPTVFSKEAARFQYEQSLFVRMQSNHPNDVHLLDTQYRMHPDISLFPSQSFYDSRLLDGPDMAGLRKRPWHSNTMLAPYRFFDVRGQHQSASKGHSLINLAEIEVAMCLFNKLVSSYREYDFKGKIGIITPYKSQLRELKSSFARRFGEAVSDSCEFNTTDAYQGRESEVIIFSCVRASPTGGIGFLQDIRRMNVGLTRAKSSLWVLGNSDSLMKGEYWSKLVQNAKARNMWTNGNLLKMIAASSGGSGVPPPSMPSHRAPMAASQSAAVSKGYEDTMELDAPSRKSSIDVHQPSMGRKNHSSDGVNLSTVESQSSIAMRKESPSGRPDVDMDDVPAEPINGDLRPPAKKSDISAAGTGFHGTHPEPPNQPAGSSSLTGPLAGVAGTRPIAKKKRPANPLMPLERQKRPRP